jgi:hypothetical protein
VLLPRVVFFLQNPEPVEGPVDQFMILDLPFNSTLPVCKQVDQLNKQERNKAGFASSER